MTNHPNNMFKLAMLLLALAVVGWLLSLMLSPKPTENADIAQGEHAHHQHQEDNSQPQNKVENTAQSTAITCNQAQQWCGNDVIQVQFDRAPKPMEPFKLLVKLVHPAQTVSADFTMPDMDMGENRYALQQAQALWQADVTLPVCMHGGADWLMDIDAQGEHGQQKLQVTFKTP